MENLTLQGVGYGFVTHAFCGLGRGWEVDFFKI